jgi:hypothetical protein
MRKTPEFRRSNKAWRNQRNLDAFDSTTELKGIDRKTGFKIARMALAFMGLVTRAQTNGTIDRYTIDAGGGASTGGVCRQRHAVLRDQPDAGMTSGDNDTLEGGFRGIIAAGQMPGESKRKDAVFTISCLTAGRETGKTGLP